MKRGMLKKNVIEKTYQLSLSNSAGEEKEEVFLKVTAESEEAAKAKAPTGYAVLSVKEVKDS